MNSLRNKLSDAEKKLPPIITEKNKKKNTSESEEDDEDIEDIEENEEIDENEEKMVNSTKKIDQNASFFASFIDGSSFRYLIEYLRLSSSEGTFVFTKDYITFQKQDEDETILNDVKIKAYELTDYEFSTFNSEITATINLAELRNKTRTVGKKEQLEIYRRPEEPTNFYIQVRSQEKSSGDNSVFYCMNMKSENVIIFKLPEFTRSKKQPNVTIYQSDFSKLCKALVANKCIYTEFIGFDKGIIIKGYGSDGKIIMIKEYGKCKSVQNNKSSTTKSVVQTNYSDSNTIKPQIAPPKLNVKDLNEIERFKYHITVIKSLSKINGFSNNGTIKFYIEHNLPMKAVVNIGSFGKLTILLRSSV